MSGSKSWFFLFLLFLASNSLLSYSKLPWGAKLAVGLLGILFPFLLALRFLPTPQTNGRFQKEFLPSFPAWVWALPVAVLGAAGVRFFGLNSFPGFPLYDEAVNGFYAMDLAEHWNWRFFQSATQLPPLFNWALALGFKAFGPSLAAMRLLSALISTACAFLSYAASRNFFAKGFSFWLFLFVSLGFWPVLAGRFAHQGLLMLLWEWVGLWLLGWLRRASTPKSRWAFLVLLGLCVGSGFYTYFSWILVALFIGGACWKILEPVKKPRKAVGMGVFVLTAVLTALPLGIAAVQTGFGGYLWGLFALNPQAQNGGAAEWPLSALENVGAVFWMGWKGYFSYGPAWGGLLNPVTGGFFFTGLLALFRHRRHPAAGPMGWAVLIGFVPILFSGMFNVFHLVHLVPLVYGVVVLGFLQLAESLPKGKVKLLLGGLLMLSMGLDGMNLHYTSLDIDTVNPAQKPAVDVKAWEILRGIAEKEGPGLFFSSFNVDPSRPPFLEVACAAFDGLYNPRIPEGKCAWAALIENVNYQPCLSRQFPGGRFFWLSKDHPPSDGGMMLWVHPLEPAPAQAFDKWKQAAWALVPFQEDNVMKNDGAGGRILLADLDRAYPAFQGDPLLESFYWEKVSDIRFQSLLLASYFKTTGRRLSEMPSGRLFPGEVPQPEWKAPIENLLSALDKGCPAANLYFHLGVLYSLAGEKAQARRAFEGALRSPLDFTDSRRFLARLSPVDDLK